MNQPAPPRHPSAGFLALLWATGACVAPAAPSTGGATSSSSSSGGPTATGSSSGAGTAGASSGATGPGGSGTGGTSDTGTDTGTSGGAVGCAPDPDADSDPFADCVVSFSPAPGVSFGHDALPQIVLGWPMGGGAGGGGLDVASLGCGGQIVLAFDGPGIADGPGPDLLVFENPFATGQTTFTEPARVEVSEDGVRWTSFPCTPSGDGTWPPAGCAGVRPVLANANDPGIDPTDPDQAGGDAFDLADVGLSRARYLRLTDVTEAHYGDATWCAGAAGGFDLDALAIVHEATP